jgi:WD40 repeat protein
MLSKKAIFLFLTVLITLYAAISCLPVISDEAKTDSQADSSPYLRIETGMHTSMIRRISIDAKQKILATASDDKTVRIFALRHTNSDVIGQGDKGIMGSLSNHNPPELLRVIRPPLGDGDEGKLYAVALNPEGTILATGGWTSKDGLSNSIYIFDIALGELQYSIKGLEHRIRHLSFSSDGKYLLATLGGGKGIRIYQKKKDKYTFFAEDKDYSLDSYWGEFNTSAPLANASDLNKSLSSGMFEYQFATTSDDGNIRFYAITEIGLSKPIKIKTKSGKQPYSLCFSYDGKNIAVGYDDLPRIDVYSIIGSKIEYSFSPDTSFIKNDAGNLARVIYSGDFLYAGGTYNYMQGNSEQETNPILKFQKSGKGKPILLPVSQTTITDLLPDGKSGVIFSTAYPMLAQLDRNRKIISVRNSDVLDFRNTGGTEIKSEFYLSEDNKTIGFGDDSEGRTVFSLLDRVVVSGAPNSTEKTHGLASLHHEKIIIENWFNDTAPTCNGKPVSLLTDEITHSLSIHKDGSAFVLGADWSLRYFDSTCTELWNSPVPGTTWAVNLSQDRRYVLAAFSDGTIRWFSTTGGKELLAFFLHADKKRWVLWSPEGYYDTSLAGENLIGWHLNRGIEKESDFFSVGKFRDAYYRPDIITRILEVGDSQRAITEANAIRQKKEALPVTKYLPSVVRILVPPSGKPVKGELVNFMTKIRSPAGLKVKELKVYIDDNLVETYPVNFLPSDSEDLSEFEFQLKVPHKESMNISVVTVTEQGASNPERIILLGQQGEEKKPDLHLLSVGIGKYKDVKNVRALHYSVSDARDFFSIMKKQEGKVYNKVHSEEKYLLTDEGATRAKVFELIKEIRTRANSTQDNVTMVFLAGHGTSDVDNRFYFLPHDYNSSPEEKDSTGLSGSELLTQLSKIKGKVILFVDACYSGSLSSRLNMIRLLNESNDPDKWFVVFSSSSKFEESLEHRDWQNGAFTKALKEAMIEGKLNEPTITIKGLDYYISKRVPVLTKNKQKPESQGTGRDFIIAEAFEN